MPFVTVTKAQFAKLKGHHLDALQYLLGGKWGCREGPVEERREATWASLAANPEARYGRALGKRVTGGLSGSWSPSKTQSDGK